MTKLFGTAVSLMLMASPLLADLTQPPSALHCTVKTVTPVNASFFGNGRRVQVSDTIDLDLTANEITKLKFASGAAIPLEQAKAKLVKKTVAGEEAYRSFYEGTHKSVTSDYIGVLHASHDEGVSFVGIELLRKEFFGGMTLHQLSMECTQVP